MPGEQSNYEAMIKTYDEEVFFNRLRKGGSFHPSNYGYILFRNGTLELELNAVVYSYQQGDILLISPNNLYKLVRYTDDLQVALISINRDQLRQRLNFNFNRYEAYRIINIEKNNNVIKLSKADFKHTVDLSNQLNYYLKHTDSKLFREEILLNLLSAIIYIIARDLLQTNHPVFDKNTRKEEITMRFIELASAHYKDEKELKFYADQLSISIKYLSNAVRTITNVPPTRFIAASLVNEAKLQLLNRDLTVGAISDHLGFSDQYAFGKFFKKHTGLSPRNFKNQNIHIDTI